jgi:acetyl-CoA C-acetyltransferase
VTLKDVSPVDLAAHVMKAAVAAPASTRSNSTCTSSATSSSMATASCCRATPRIKAGIPVEVDGYAVDMLCSSGMMSVMNAATAIRAGEADLVLAGGVESMSQAGFVLSAQARAGATSCSSASATEQLQDACSSTA